MEKNNQERKKKFDGSVHPIHPIHMSKLLIIVILLSILLIVMLKPSIDNFIVRSRLRSLGITPSEIISNLDLKEKENEFLRANLSTCKEVSSRTILENEILKSNNFNLSNRILQLESDLRFKDIEKSKEIERINASFNDKIKENNMLVIQAESKVSEIEAKYDSLLTSSARRICCMAKVDNSEINSYDVVAGRITCLSNGEYELVC